MNTRISTEGTGDTKFKTKNFINNLVSPEKLGRAPQIRVYSRNGNEALDLIPGEVPLLKFTLVADKRQLFLLIDDDLHGVVDSDEYDASCSHDPETGRQVSDGSFITDTVVRTGIESFGIEGPHNNVLDLTDESSLGWSLYDIEDSDDSWTEGDQGRLTDDLKSKGKHPSFYDANGMCIYYAFLNALLEDARGVAFLEKHARRIGE